MQVTNLIPIQNKSLNILVTNVQGIYQKKELLFNRLLEKDIQIGIICETWIKQEKDFSFSPYQVFEKRRTEQNGGGIAVLLDPGLSVRQINTNYKELIALKIITEQNVGILLFGVYI